MKEIFDPIRDHYTFAHPCGELTNHIDFFSESIVNDREFTVEMFPSWTPTMYINLGNPYRISLQNSIWDVKANADILVLRDLPTIRHNQPGDRIFTIKFKPGGLEAILSISQISIKGKIVGLHHILPAFVIEQLRHGPTFDDRRQIAESYFLENHSRRGIDHYVTFVQDLSVRYQNADIQLNVSQLAEKYFVTSKTINRYFNRVIGTNPKNYFSILRARTALTAYTASREFDPSDFGYYDGSHFYWEMIKFTGKPLSNI